MIYKCKKNRLSNIGFYLFKRELIQYKKIVKVYRFYACKKLLEAHRFIVALRCSKCGSIKQDLSSKDIAYMYNESNLDIDRGYSVLLDLYTRLK